MTPEERNAQLAQAIAILEGLKEVIVVAPAPVPTPVPPPPAPVPPPPAPVATWSTPALLSAAGGTYQNIAASGKNVVVARGDGTLYVKSSQDEGKTFDAFRQIGFGTLYLDQPVAGDGDNFAIVATKVTKNVIDFIGSRPVGDHTLNTSTDGGKTWGLQKQITTGAQSLRHAVAVKGTEVHVAWMDFRRGVWDIYYGVWGLSGNVIQAPYPLVRGSGLAGAERPFIAISGEDIHLTWMDGRDGKGLAFMEQNYQIKNSTEVYYKRCRSGVWGPDRRMTVHPVNYSGRPAIAASGSNVCISYDFNPNVSGGNEIKALYSTDGGDTFAPLDVSNSPTDSTHSVVSGVGDSFAIAWKENADQGDYVREMKAGVLGPILKVGGPSLHIPFLAESDGYTHLMQADQSGRILHSRKARSL